MRLTYSALFGVAIIIDCILAILCAINNKEVARVSPASAGKPIRHETRKPRTAKVPGLVQVHSDEVLNALNGASFLEKGMQEYLEPDSVYEAVESGWWDGERINQEQIVQLKNANAELDKQRNPNSLRCGAYGATPRICQSVACNGAKEKRRRDASESKANEGNQLANDEYLFDTSCESGSSQRWVCRNGCPSL